MIEPLDYKSQSSGATSTTITLHNIIEFCLSLLGATSYGEIYNLHAVVVDKNEENYFQRTCQTLATEMAKMFSVASKLNVFVWNYLTYLIN